jgi:hypothetical protein
MNLVLSFLVGILLNLTLLYFAIESDVLMLIIIFATFVIVQVITYVFIFIKKIKVIKSWFHDI